MRRFPVSLLCLVLVFSFHGSGRSEELYSRPDTSTASDSVVSFNEIHYFPSGNDSEAEWIEIFNQMSVDMDLSQWKLSGGVDFEFPANVTLQAGGYLVIAANPSRFNGAGFTVLGPYTRRLSNSGETLRLINKNGRLLDEMTYTDVAPWPAGADGSGGTLAKKGPYAASSPGQNWRVSSHVGGTPGKENFPDQETEPVERVLATHASAAKFIIPSGNLPASWTEPGFDDGAWQEGTAAPGYFVESGNPSVGTVARSYSFEGNLQDSSGNGFHGQGTDVSYTTQKPESSKEAQSVQFNGTTSRVTVPDPVNPDGYTISLWVRVGQVRPCSLITRTDNSGPTISWSHQLRIGASGRFEHYIFDGGGRAVTFNSAVQANTWYHLAATASSGGALRIYVNGVPSASVISNVGELWSGGNQWQLGSNSGHTANFFQGQLDMVGIWHSVLSQEEITALAAGTPPHSLNGYSGLISTDVRPQMHNQNSSLLLRIPFITTAGALFDRLSLETHFDDGFVAYLNGHEVARQNAPATLNWNSAALSKRTPEQALQAQTIDLSSALQHLTPGNNVLAVHALNSAANDAEFLFRARLTTREAPVGPLQETLVLNEIGAQGQNFFVEIMNRSAAPVALAGTRIMLSTGGSYTFANGTLAPGQMTVRTAAQLGFSPQEEDRVFLLSPALAILDAARTSLRSQGKDGRGQWLFTSRETPGAANEFDLRDEIVINEVMYNFPDRYLPGSNTNPVEQPEQWIELFNRSESEIDLTGWSVSGGATFFFGQGVRISPGEFLVIARDSAALRLKYPKTRILGDFQGRLSRRGDQILLSDANGNPADEVNYYDYWPWPGYADGGGSSLELRDPWADNSVPEAWAASDESHKGVWKRYTYRASAVNPQFSPPTAFFREFRLGLLNDGEALVDNVRVVELPGTELARNLIQNSNFETNTAAWRLLGNHSQSRLQPDPIDPENQVLRVVAKGTMSYLDNRLETTFRVNGNYVAAVTGREYEFSFDARWVAGSPQLHSEIYYNKVTTTHILDVPELLGTPGTTNSSYKGRVGPTFRNVRHEPVLPAAGQAITVSGEVTHSREIAGVLLHYAVNSGPWRSVPASRTTSGEYEAVIPGQSGTPVIQFYLEAIDDQSVSSWYPAEGPDSRALIKVGPPADGQNRQVFRIVMTSRDSTLMHTFVNLMSDDLIGCTIIHNEREVFYNAKIRLHGSMFSRQTDSTTGFTVKFPSDHLFRGTRPSVVVRRSGMVESFLKHLVNKAGGLPINHDDIVYLVSHRPGNIGPARLNLANYDDTFVDSLFPGDNDGTVFKFEGIRIYQQTDNNSPEGKKLPQPVDFAWSYDLTNLGDSKEQYRWSIMIGNRRDADDYSRIINMCKSFALSGPALQNAISSAIDVDEWARMFAIQNLFGIGDIYGIDNPHNMAFYVRPSDGRVVALQNDWQFAFALAANASVIGKNNVFKMLSLPGIRRIYHGHLHHLATAVGDSAYLNRWAQHWGVVTAESYASAPSYIGARRNSINTQIGQPVPFEITTNGGEPISTNTPAVTLRGRGWVNVREIRKGPSEFPLRVRWVDDRVWEAQVPLAAGQNEVHLVAYDFNGLPVGDDRINVTTTVSGMTQRDSLRITELYYHPSDPTAQELSGGFSDKNSFEYVEIANLGAAEISLLGARFTFGIEFDFTTGSITNIGPGERVVVVRNRAAFEARFGSGRPVAGEYTGQLDNAGETIQFVDSFGSVIQELSYGDSTPWPSTPDGSGPSLEAIDPTLTSSDPANWRASAVHGGTPGRGGSGGAPTISSLLDGGEIQISFVTEPGQPYSILFTEDVAGGEWELLRSVSPENLPRTEVVTETIRAGASTRFYRISSP